MMTHHPPPRGHRCTQPAPALHPNVLRLLLLAGYLPAVAQLNKCSDAAWWASACARPCTAAGEQICSTAPACAPPQAGGEFGGVLGNIQDPGFEAAWPKSPWRVEQRLYQGYNQLPAGSGTLSGDFTPVYTPGLAEAVMPISLAFDSTKYHFSKPLSGTGCDGYSPTNWATSLGCSYPVPGVPAMSATGKGQLTFGSYPSQASGAFPSCTRSILTEIHLCYTRYEPLAPVTHRSCHESEDGNARAGLCEHPLQSRGSSQSGHHHPVERR
jgi:hypothetical protein